MGCAGLPVQVRVPRFYNKYMKVKLLDFDSEYYRNLEDRDAIIPPSNNTVYHIIEVNGFRAGIVGYIPLKKDISIGFIQIILKPEYRGKGILSIAEELLVKKYNITKLYATIKERNIASIEAHKKVGFIQEDKNVIEELRKLGYLHRDQVRLFKEFT